MQGPDDMVLPEVTFSTFVLSLASSALVQMGEVPEPETGKHPELARHSIDVLNMLDDKIANGLTDKEARLLKDVLFELRMKYVAAGK